MPDSEQQARINFLAKKWQDGTITPEEKKEFDSWYDTMDNMLELVGDETRAQAEKRIYTSILVKGNIRPQKIVRLWSRIAAAASILLAISVGVYFFSHKPQIQKQTVQNHPHDIAPGHNQATLTLANGKSIILTKGLDGRLAQQGTTVISVNAGSEIAYKSSNSSVHTTIQYNTLSTATGEQSPYPLVLPDGSKVWLNNSSSITFPTTFADNERIVTVTGEAYFEVAHNNSKPFKVKIKDQTIQDIGTHFNVNGFDNEPVVSTTLIEGSVKVYTNTTSVLLKPGQQSDFGNGRFKVTQVDADDAIAWKEGYFQFNSDNLESGMRKIARWYNVDVAYKNDALRKQALAGTISKYSNVSQILKKMELTGVIHFSLSGRKITVE